MNDNLVKRITDSQLKGDFVDGQIYLHTDVNKLEDISKTGINENFYDIQKILNGTKMVGNSLL